MTAWFTVCWLHSARTWADLSQSNLAETTKPDGGVLYTTGSEYKTNWFLLYNNIFIKHVLVALENIFLEWSTPFSATLAFWQAPGTVHECSYLMHLVTDGLNDLARPTHSWTETDSVIQVIRRNVTPCCESTLSIACSSSSVLDSLYSTNTNRSFTDIFMIKRN